MLFLQVNDAAVRIRTVITGPRAAALLYMYHIRTGGVRREKKRGGTPLTGCVWLTVIEEGRAASKSPH
jgi:hypothetical protein